MTLTKSYCVDAEVEFKVNEDRRGRVVGVTAEYPDHGDEYRKVKWRECSNGVSRAQLRSNNDHTINGLYA